MAMVGVTTEEEFDILDAELKPKTSSRFVVLLGKVASLFGQKDWMDLTWVTIGKTIYHPESVSHPWDFRATIAHELTHVRQQSNWPKPLWLALYALFPLPFGFAWFRWRMEREAYLVDLSFGNWTIDTAVWSLWKYYGRPWPRKWMRRWFEKHARKVF